MVVIPAGKFTAVDFLRPDNFEPSPPREVEIASFALGQFEITRGQYRACVNAGACGAEPLQRSFDYFVSSALKRSPGGDEASFAMTSVTTEDIDAYLKWLSRVSGKSYRLPTSDEWEYGARAGTRSLYFWGDSPLQACRFGDIQDRSRHSVAPFVFVKFTDCDDGSAFGTTVGRYAPNPFGVYDTTGGVSEIIIAASALGVGLVVKGAEFASSFESSPISETFRAPESSSYTGFRVVRNVD